MAGGGRDANAGGNQRKSKHRGANRKHHNHEERSAISSNKDLLQAYSNRNQQFPMFGYQIESSETAGIGVIYENTNKNNGTMPNSKQHH